MNSIESFLSTGSKVTDAQLKQWADLWVNRFRLQGWDIRWSWVDKISLDDPWGVARSDPMTMRAEISIRRPRSSAFSEVKEVLKTIIHELLHVLLSDLEKEESSSNVRIEERITRILEGLLAAVETPLEREILGQEKRLVARMRYRRAAKESTVDVKQMLGLLVAILGKMAGSEDAALAEYANGMLEANLAKLAEIAGDDAEKYAAFGKEVLDYLDSQMTAGQGEEEGEGVAEKDEEEEMKRLRKRVADATAALARFERSRSKSSGKADVVARLRAIAAPSKTLPASRGNPSDAQLVERAKEKIPFARRGKVTDEHLREAARKLRASEKSHGPKA